MNVLWDARPSAGDRIVVIGGGVMGCSSRGCAGRFQEPVSLLSTSIRAREAIVEGGGSDQPVAPPSLVVVQNWGEELKRLVPTR